MESKSKSTVCLLLAPFSLVNYKMLGIPQFCKLFVCGKRLYFWSWIFLSVVYRVLHSDNLGLIVVIRWKNNKIYGVVFILISYMIDEVKHVVLLMLHLEPNHRKQKIQY